MLMPVAETANEKSEVRSQKSEAAPTVVPALEGDRAVDSRLRHSTSLMALSGESKGGNDAEKRGNDFGSEAAGADERLMAFIARRWDAAIRAACRGTSLVPEFLAALIANESGGRADACRYEPIVYGALVKVQQGRKPRFGGFIREQLADKTPGELRALATSWGLTQIMGYNAAAKGVRVGFTGEEARAPETNLALAAEMLTDFARRFHLDPARDFPALLHTWNTGSPDGRTFDPEYVPRALQRMEIYRQLAESSRQ
jgi:transglycosylase-like protein with SLT domain